MTEAEETRVLANRILDRPNGDPDDDLAMLSRQLLRADERIARLESRCAALELELARLTEALADIQEIADRETANEGRLLEEIVRCSMNALAVPERRKAHRSDYRTEIEL
jgi:uncharacterized coiled-coil protein SlyX